MVKLKYRDQNEKKKSQNIETKSAFTQKKKKKRKKEV